MGADVAVGSMQRFGLPMMFGGPHPGYFAVKNKFIRQMPGRIVGISKDADGNQALKLIL
jgi:glycine dehydrogenase